VKNYIQDEDPNEHIPPQMRRITHTLFYDAAFKHMKETILERDTKPFYGVQNARPPATPI
jgi:hypothetical protein